MTTPWRCKSCDTLFVVQPDECVSCGARKLYDKELRGAWADNERLRAQVAKLREALGRTAANTCCAQCREAALVARAALKETER